MRSPFSKATEPARNYPAPRVIRGGADKLFDAAIGHHRQGHLVDAEKFYRAAIAAEPTRIGAPHNLGLITTQSQ
jgi:hypothetical protein